MTRKRRWILIAIGVAAVALVLSLTLRESRVEVETARVTRDTLEAVVQDEGRTRVRQRYVVAAPVTGRIERIRLDEGESVTEGAIVARIASAPEDPRTFSVARAQLAAAEARRAEVAVQVEETRGRLEQETREAARLQALEKAGAVSRQAAEQAELAAASARRASEAAQAALRGADAEVRAARAALTGAAPQTGRGTMVEVRAPAAGRVLRVLEESERVVPAGTPLLEVGSARGLEVVVDVLSEDAVRITPGDAVRIHGWGGDRTLHGQVRLVEPAAFTEVSALGVEEQRVNVIIDLAKPPASLGAGYRVEATIVTWAGGDVLSVPTSALFQQEGAWHVFVVNDGRAARRAIQLGHRNADAAEVAGGLNEGDTVILFPSDLVADGVPVRARSP